MRIGFGYDVHKLVEGRKCIICGVDVPHTKGLLGHSDADVAIHALCDALLGAAALGDIGRLFPDTSDEFKDIDVKVQAIATGNCAAKVKNEGKDIEADIILDLETAHMKNLEENFVDLSDFDSSIYLEGVNKSKNYFTWVKYTMNLIIDKKYFKSNRLCR